jgi:primosomal protein N' (replication factor Y)
MIAKGHDFPDVELIGIINADTSLALPDFRAEERTFQLVSQVAGRAGRSPRSAPRARVIVQTFSPGAASIRAAARHDYRAFADSELDARRQVRLPPVGRMARIVCRDTDPDRADARALALRRALDASPQPLRLRGPMPCPLARLAGFHRVAVELLADTPAPIQAALASLRTLGLARSDAQTAVDVDPVSLL